MIKEAIRLIPETSGEETPFMQKTPFAGQPACKIEAMTRHLDNPGPLFDELLLPGGWTSDLRDRLPNPAEGSDGPDRSDGPDGSRGKQ